MNYHRNRLDSGIIRTSINGKMDLESSLSSLDNLSEYIEANSLYEVVVHEEGAEIHVGFEEADTLVKKAQKLFGSLDAGAVAFVSDDDLLFGLCRQLQMRIKNEKIQLTVFRNESTAVQWLLELKATFDIHQSISS